MIIQHWTSGTEDTVSTIEGIEDMKAKHLLGENQKYCCTINGDSWEDCMTKYHEHQGWEPYIPMEP